MRTRREMDEESSMGIVQVSEELSGGYCGSRRG